jgi:uncharacterized protein with NAD-binding domain and iron-sulfur cluster
MPKKVIVFGGGVAGLSAAHELVKAGYHVEVYESRADLGGKARSQRVAGTGRGLRADLPGEHGFRFYPAFYKHLIETMREIPLDPAYRSGLTVADNLRPCAEAGCAPADGGGVRRFLRRKPGGATDLVGMFELLFKDLSGNFRDVAFFAQRALRYVVSCERRRNEKYEEISWWDFILGDRYEPNTQKYLKAMPRIMVAMDPMYGSARTIGNISMQLMADYGTRGAENDRTMIGPTTEVWIQPWKAYLESCGVILRTGKGLLGFDFDPRAGVITGARVQGEPLPVTADYYIAAAPLEVIVNLVTEEMAAYDPAELGKLRRIRAEGRTDCAGVLANFKTRMVDWMVGAQFFLREDVPLPRGHIFYPDSPWALSSISQAPFWEMAGKGFFRDRFGDGDIGGILSVDISNWNEKGLYVTKPAKLCSREEIRKEVWEQIKAGVNRAGAPILKDTHLHPTWNLDQDIDFPESNQLLPVNHSPLLVHPPGSWDLRPSAETGVQNLMLASDYVRTETILACMEGANEAARLAVRAILRREGREEASCSVWKLKENAFFDRAKRVDEMALRLLSRGAEPENPDSFFHDGARKRPLDLEEVRRMERRLIADPENA